MWITHAVGDDHGKLAGNPGEEYICFHSGMIPGLSPGDTHVGFEMVNGTLHNGSDFIKRNPFIRIPLDTWKHTEVHVFVSIGCVPLFSGAAGLLTITYPPPFYHVDFWADPFVAVGPPFLMAVPGVFHVQGAVFGAGGIAVRVIADFFNGTFVSRDVRDQRLGRVESIPEETVSFDRVKSGITQKGIRMEIRVE